MRRATQVTVLLMSAILTLTVGGAAHAEQKSFTDEFSPKLPVNTDIRSVGIDNAADNVTIRVGLHATSRKRKARVQVAIIDPRDDTNAYIAKAVKRPGQPKRTVLLVATNQEFGGTPVACAAIKSAWTWRARTVTITIPQSCLSNLIAAKPPMAPVKRYEFKAVTGFWRPMSQGDYTTTMSVKLG